MKKLALILLAAIYALAIVGATPSAGYCCEKTVYDNAGENCCNEPSGAELQTQHIATANFHFSSRIFNAVHNIAAGAEPVAIHPVFFGSTTYSRPGPQHAVPVYILHCVYRI